MAGSPPSTVALQQAAMELDPALRMRAGIAEFQDALQDVADERISSLDAKFGPGQAAHSQHGIIINRKRGRDDTDDDEDDYTRQPKKQRQKAFYAWLGGLPKAITPTAMRPRRIITPKGFDLLSSLMGTTELAVEIAKYLPYKDLLTIYSVSPIVKATFDAHLTSSLKAIAEYKYPGSFANFHWSKYPKLTIPDPMGRPKDAGDMIIVGSANNFNSPQKSVPDPTMAKQVPTLRWLGMVGHRHRAICDIVATMAGVNLRLPNGWIDTLKKLWAFNEVDTTAKRTALLADRDAFTNEDLYIIHTFVDNIRCFMTDESVVDVPWVIFMGLYNGFGLFARYMRRQSLQDINSIMLYTLMYDNRYVTPQMIQAGANNINQHVSGNHVLYRGHLEGFGSGNAHLARIDELLPVEIANRGHLLDGDPACQALWGDMGPVPEEEDLVVTTEDGPVQPMSDELKWIRDQRLPFTLREVSPISAKQMKFRDLTPAEKMEVWQGTNDDKLRALADSVEDGFHTWALKDTFKGADWFDEDEARDERDINDHDSGADTPMEQYQALGMGLFSPRHQSMIRQAVRRVSQRAGAEQQEIEDEVEAAMNCEEGDDPEWEAEFYGHPFWQTQQHAMDEDDDADDEADDSQTVVHGHDSSEDDDDESDDDSDDEMDQDNGSAPVHPIAWTHPNNPAANPLVASAAPPIAAPPPPFNLSIPMPAIALPTFIETPPGRSPIHQQKQYDPLEDAEEGPVQDVTDMLHKMVIAKRRNGQIEGRYREGSMEHVFGMVCGESGEGISEKLVSNVEREVLEEGEKPVDLSDLITDI